MRRLKLSLKKKRGSENLEIIHEAPVCLKELFSRESQTDVNQRHRSTNIPEERYFVLKDWAN